LTTPFDVIQNDRQLQEHWVRRLVAFIIDAIIIGIAIWIFTFIFAFGFFWFSHFSWFFMWSFINGSITLLYTGFFEGIRGATIGKELLKLKVICHQDRMDFVKGLIRNVSKIFWVLLILDLLIAFFTDGHPKQRYLDRIANTTVEDVRELNAK